MSVSTITPQAGPATGTKDIVATPNATKDEAVVSGTVELSYVEIDNSLNSAASYVKFYDASSITVGTTAPDMILKVAASEVLRAKFVDDKPRFTTALSWCCVTAGGTAGSTAPTNTVTMKVTTNS